RTGAQVFDGALRLADPYRLQRVAARAGGAAARAVRPGRHAAYRRGPARPQAAPVVARAAPRASHPGSGELLGQHLCRGEERPQGTLSQALLARRSPDRRTHGAGQAAAVGAEVPTSGRTFCPDTPRSARLPCFVSPTNALSMLLASQ